MTWSRTPNSHIIMPHLRNKLKDCVRGTCWAFRALVGNRADQSITSKWVRVIPWRAFWATVVELHSFDPDKTRIPFKWSGCTSNGSAHLARKDSYSVLHLVASLTKHCPCPWALSRSIPSQGWFRRLPSRSEVRRNTTPAPTSSFAHFPIKGRGFFSSCRKLEAHRNDKSAIGNKVTGFTAHDPNTCWAKLAFSHSNGHKTRLGRHLIFTICPYCKIKAVASASLGISLWLTAS